MLIEWFLLHAGFPPAGVDLQVLLPRDFEPLIFQTSTSLGAIPGAADTVVRRGERGLAAIVFCENFGDERSYDISVGGNDEQRVGFPATKQVKIPISGARINEVYRKFKDQEVALDRDHPRVVTESEGSKILNEVLSNMFGSVGKLISMFPGAKTLTRWVTSDDEKTFVLKYVARAVEFETIKKYREDNNLPETFGQDWSQAISSSYAQDRAFASLHCALGQSPTP